MELQVILQEVIDMIDSIIVKEMIGDKRKYKEMIEDNVFS